MGPRHAKYSAVVAVFFALVTAPRAVPVTGFDALAPDVTLSGSERAALASGAPVVHLRVGRDGHLSLTGIVRVQITADRFLRWTANVETLQKGKYVPEIGRFSPTPRLEDLRGLSIPGDDLNDLARCRPGDCGLKLSAEEITRLAGRRPPDEVGRELRSVLLQRAIAYQRRGDFCAPPYLDHDVPVHPSAAFEGVLQRLAFLPRHIGCYADFLRRYPALSDEHVQQSFLYWSKEDLGLKPIISITHFSAARFAQPHLPEAVVVAKQVYASHYKNASITVTALAADAEGQYVVYINRTHVDAFGGVLGGMVRRLVERRVNAEAPKVLLKLRTRLESGDPPA